MPLKIADLNELKRRKYYPERRRAVRIKWAAALCKEKAAWLDIKVGEHKEELEAAYRLLHDVYVKMGYMDPCPSQMRISIYNALPHTTTFIARECGRIIGTITLIIDSALGLPMEEIYPKEVSYLRIRRLRLAEVSGLALSPDHRYEKTFMHLNQFLVAFALFAGVSDILITVNPRHVGFYQDILFFEPIGPEKPYTKVKGAPAVAMHLDLKAAENRVKEEYSFNEFDADLYTFFFTRTRNLFTVDRFKEEFARVIMTPECLSYFFVKKTNIFKEATTSQLQHLRYYYPTYDFTQIFDDELLKQLGIK